MLFSSLISYSQTKKIKPKKPVIKVSKDTLCYWNGKLIPSKQVDDSLLFMFTKFNDSLKKTPFVR